VTIPDYRGKVLAGASAVHPAGTTGGADTADLSHAHDRGSLQMNSHDHEGGTLAWSHRHSIETTEYKLASGEFAVEILPMTYAGSDYNGWTGKTTSAQPTIIGTTGDAGSATQDIRQATAYVYRFIYVGE
jgi:hypothetical protein